MKFIRRFSAVVIGIVFFVAGLLKLMDPVGAGLVVDEYFKFFHLRFLSFSSGVTGFALAALETLTGAALITGVFRKFVSVLSGLMLLFFTLITLVLVIFNPSMDCGCFGEALHLTHMQSFLKNLLLCALWIGAFIPIRNVGKPSGIKYFSFSLAVLVVGFFAFHGLVSIPMIDFTNYSPGTELMSVYDGPEWNAQILSFSDAEGQYLDTVAVSGNVLIVSVFDPEKLSEKKWEEARTFCAEASENGFRPLLLVASTPSRMSSIAETPDCTCYADRRDLLTLNRSNGGATMIIDGMIVTKWPAARIPEPGLLSKIMSIDATDVMMRHNTRKRLVAQSFALGTLALMLVL